MTGVQTCALPISSSTCPKRTSPGANNACGVVVPKLRSLKLKTFPWHPSLLSDVERCLEWRSERGTYLEKLYIEVYDRKRDPEGAVALELQHIAQLVALQMQVNGLVEYVDAPRPSLTAVMY